MNAACPGCGVIWSKFQGRRLVQMKTLHYKQVLGSTKPMCPRVVCPDCNQAALPR